MMVWKVSVSWDLEGNRTVGPGTVGPCLFWALLCPQKSWAKACICFSFAFLPQTCLWVPDSSLGVCPPGAHLASVGEMRRWQ